MAPGFFAGPCILAETAATTPPFFGGGDDLVKKNGAPQHHAFILLKSSLGACDPASHVKRVSLG